MPALVKDCSPMAPFFAPTDTLPRRWLSLGVLLLMLAVSLAYSNVYKVPFLFDDEGSILTNPTIKSWRTVLFPPGDTGDTVGGRPLLNISLAVNYAISGTKTWSYHLANVLIHLSADLVLFGLLRRTLAGPGVRWEARAAFCTALTASLFWLVHPLQTESVTYIVQRAESLMALMYLLTLYCFARATEPSAKNPNKWFTFSIFFCAFGMASKEVMVSAPVLALLYDRAFVSGSFRKAWRQRKGFYLLLAATWIVLGLCLSISGFRGGTSGFGTPMTWWMYALRQCEGIVIYLKLVFWPAPLVFDYGIFYVTDFWSVWPQVFFMVALCAATLWAMLRHPRIGICGALFFAVLSPSSSVLPVISQTLAEHRMYLPLAAVIVFIVVGCAALVRQLVKLQKRPASVRAAALALTAAVATALGVVTWNRNALFQDVVTIWKDTVAKMPLSHRAQNNVGCALIDAKRQEEGIPYCIEATRLKPDYGEAYGNIGYGLSGLKKHAESIPYYEQALLHMRKMKFAGLDHVLLNMGLSLHELGRDTEARAAFEEAIQANPKNAPSLNNIGNYEFFAGRYTEAKKYYLRAIKADPQFAEAWYDLGNAIVAIGESWAEAERLYRRALELSPDMILAQDNLARLLIAMNRPEEAAPFFKNVACETPSVAAKLNAARALMLSGKHAEAIPLLQDAIKTDANSIDAHYLLGNARYRTSAKAEAMTAYRQAIHINPFAVEPHGNLGSLLASEGQWGEAIIEIKAALHLKPDYAEAHNNLANAFAQLGHDAEACPHYKEAIRLKPELAQAHYNFARLLMRAKETQAARQHVQKAIHLHPDYTEAKALLTSLSSLNSTVEGEVLHEKRGCGR